MTLRPIRSNPAPRRMSRRRGTTPSVAWRATRQCRKEIMFSRITGSGERIFIEPAVQPVSNALAKLWQPSGQGDVPMDVGYQGESGRVWLTGGKQRLIQGGIAPTGLRPNA